MLSLCSSLLFYYNTFVLYCIHKRPININSRKKKSFPQFSEEEIELLSTKKPSPSAPPSNEKSLDKRFSKINIKGDKHPDDAESQKKALQNLDQMVKNIYEADLPGMCFLPPPNSRSDGYLQGACK